MTFHFRASPESKTRIPDESSSTALRRGGSTSPPVVRHGESSSRSTAREMAAAPRRKPLGSAVGSRSRSPRKIIRLPFGSAARLGAPAETPPMLCSPQNRSCPERPRALTLRLKPLGLPGNPASGSFAKSFGCLLAVPPGCGISVKKTKKASFFCCPWAFFALCYMHDIHY